jgi:hypothetical protein
VAYESQNSFAAYVSSEIRKQSGALLTGTERTTGNQYDDHSHNLDVVGDCGVERLSDGEAMADGLSSQ